MEKTISINLSGRNFLIEEEAYEKLDAYLESIRRHCGAGADAAEVIADIEDSMAEKLKSALSPYREIVTIADVDSLIAIMGTVEDFDREVGNAGQEENEEPAEKKKRRKLYRDTDNAVIGGVAAGLGAYFDIDPVLFRIIFCALVFAGGSAFPIYILLWIAMPEAKTAHQKLEMQGQAPTLAAFKNLAKTGKQIQESWKKQWKKRSALGKIVHLPLIIINGLFMAIKKVCKAVWPIIAFCSGLFMAIFSFIILGATGIGSLFLILYNNSSFRLSFIPISELTSIMPYVWMVLAGFLSVAIPAVLMLLGGIAIMRKKNVLNFTVGSILVGVWMAAGIFFCAACLRYYPELSNKLETYPLISETEKAVDMSGITEIEADGNRLNILISSDTSTPASLEGRWIDVDNIETSREGDKLIISEKPYQPDNVCLDCHLRSVTFRIATSSKLKISSGSEVSITDMTVQEKEVSEENIE